MIKYFLGARNQSKLALRHLTRILKVHGGKSLANVAQVVCYVTNESFSSIIMETWIEKVENEYNLTDSNRYVQTRDKSITLCDHLKRILKIIAVPNLPPCERVLTFPIDHTVNDQFYILLPRPSSL